jgi:hypothetical protein
VHEGAFEKVGAFIGRHLSNGLVPMAKNNLVEDPLLRFALDEHFQTPLLVVFRFHYVLERSIEHDLLQHVEMSCIIFEIFLELRLGEMMWIF